MLLPNQLTILRIILTPFFFYFFISDDLMFKQISAIIFIVAAFTDWYDGWLARKYNYITDWGKFWDPLADKILTFAAFFALVLLGTIELWMVILILLRDIFLTLLRVAADYKKFSFPTSRYAKIKTAVQMVFLYYLLVVEVAKSNPDLVKNNQMLFSYLTNADFIFYGMLIVTIITVHSAISYVRKNRVLVKKIIYEKA